MVEQQHQHEVIDETALKRLLQLVKRTNEYSSPNLLIDQTSFGKLFASVHHENDQTLHWLTLAEIMLLEKSLELFLNYSQKIQQNTDLRAEIMENMLDDFKKEQLIWNKMMSQQLKILEKAERYNDKNLGLFCYCAYRIMLYKERKSK